ncbi:MAG: KaiC domain-containing protein, partial [Euryarchaeota archaeon]|nr:KaiC domain-containing protein [Euryarchaeota archaeon]
MFKRIPFGIPGIDELTNGGIPLPSAILLLGDPGTGKSVITQQFIWEGLRLGQPGIYFCVDHSPQSVRENMASFGWNVKPYEDKEELILVDAFLGR